jgi:hypothetical protein
MLKNNSILLVILFTCQASKGQLNKSDSLLNKCKIQVNQTCDNKIFTDPKVKFTRKKVLKDSIFFVNMSQELRDNKPILNLRKIKKKYKFISSIDEFHDSDSTIIGAHFYSNYCSGQIFFIYKNNIKILQGLIIDSKYDWYCGDIMYSLSIIDLDHFRKNIAPIFKGHNIKEACERFVVDDGDVILHLINKDIISSTPAK